jgi:phosphopantothenoylcysteine decarboxylase/phosphopantothenate--cysteine ligase
MSKFEVSETEVLNGKKILVLISGSIAAYKTCFLLSQLVQQGCQVRVAATQSALKFIGPSTLEGLTHSPILTDTFTSEHGMDHIHLARWADLILLCPATANTLNKMAHGIGDDLVTTLFLAHDFTKPFLVAPAMNVAMYNHPATQESLKRLGQMGLQILESDSGALACGEVGLGRLMDPEEILEHIKNVFTKTKPKILITSGGTQEPIDSMRVISNLSTGKTGAALANHFYDSGYDVHYLGATTAQRPTRPHKNFSFTTFQSLNEQIEQILKVETYVGVIHAAAVSDFHVARLISGNETLDGTVGKVSSQQKLTIELAPNFKILPRLKGYSKQCSPKIIGFKFTATSDPSKRQQAVERLFADGGVDFVVHNDQSDIDRTRETHSFTLYNRGIHGQIAPTLTALATMLIAELKPLCLTPNLATTLNSKSECNP